MNLKNKKLINKSDNRLIDVYSLYNEDSIEFVSKQDERDAVEVMLYSHSQQFFNQEREFYEQAY